MLRHTSFIYRDQNYWWYQPGKIIYIAVAPCAFLLMSTASRRGRKLRSYKTHWLYSRGIEQLQCRFIYSAEGNSIRQCEAKSVQFQWRTSFGEPWVLSANTGSEKSSLEPMHPPKDKIKEVFLTQTHLFAEKSGVQASWFKAASWPTCSEVGQPVVCWTLSERPAQE